MTTALVIVDMLRDFVDGRLANPAARPTIQRIVALAEAARGREDWIVVYGNDAHHPGDVELRLFGEHAMVGTPGAEVIEELTPVSGDIVVPKRYYSAFSQTDLEATCLVHDVGRVVIVGQHTDCCVRLEFKGSSQHRLLLTGSTVARRGPRRVFSSRGSCGVGC